MNNNNNSSALILVLIIIILAALVYYLGYFPGTDRYQNRNRSSTSSGVVSSLFMPKTAEASGFYMTSGNAYGSGYTYNTYGNSYSNSSYSYSWPSMNMASSWWWNRNYQPYYPTYPTYPTYPSYPTNPQPAPRPVVNQNVNATYSLRVGQSIQVSGLSLSVLSIAEDSRCPRNVQCIQAGTVRANISLRSATSSAMTQTISLNQSITFGVYTVQLIAVTPEKYYSNQSLSSNDYVLVFNVRS